MPTIMANKGFCAFLNVVTIGARMCFGYVFNEFDDEIGIDGVGMTQLAKSMIAPNLT